MKTYIISISSAIALLIGGRVLAQEKKSNESGGTSKDASSQSAIEKPKYSVQELEDKFKATLTKATMAGRWCSIKDGTLSPEKDDKYTIVGVTKLSGDAWIINSRIQYGKKDIVAPIPVQVKWAGDAPVIIVDKLPMPGGGVYSARVLIYEHTYAGTWTGGDHGGLLTGIITNEAEDKPGDAK